MVQPTVAGPWSSTRHNRYSKLNRQLPMQGVYSPFKRNLGNHITNIGNFGSRSFNMMGRNVTYGRAGATAGLGLLAMRNGANMVDRMRYGDYGGAMMSGALTAAAGYGAYSTWMYKGALRSHFNNAAAWLMKRMR